MSEYTDAVVRGALQVAASYRRPCAFEGCPRMAQPGDRLCREHRERIEWLANLCGMGPNRDDTADDYAAHGDEWREVVTVR